MLLLTATAIKHDGTGAALPTVQQLFIPGATDARLNVAVKGQNNAAASLIGCALVLTLRAGSSPHSKTVLSIQATVDDAVNGLAHFDLTLALTSALRGGYVYDIVLLQGATSDQVVPVSPLYITNAAYQPGQAVTVLPSQLPIGVGPAGATPSLGQVISQPRATFDPNTFAQTTVTIYVRSTGNDTTGDGTLAKPYLTIARAQRDVPTILNGTKYRVDVTGYGAYNTTDPVVIQGLVGGFQYNGVGFELYASPIVDDTMALATRSQSADSITGLVTVTDTSKSWTVNQWKGYIFWQQSGGGAFTYQSGYRIVSNTATQLVVAATFVSASASNAWIIAHESCSINFNDVVQYYNNALEIVDNHCDVMITGIKVTGGTTGYAGTLFAWGMNTHRVYVSSCDIAGIYANNCVVRLQGVYAHSPTATVGGDAASSMENGHFTIQYSYIKDQYILGSFLPSDDFNVLGSVIENCNGLNSMYTQEPGLSAISVSKSELRNIQDHGIYIRADGGTGVSNISPALASLRINNSTWSAIFIERGATVGLYNIVGTGNGRYGVEVGFQGAGFGSLGHGHGITYGPGNITVTGTLGDMKVGMRPTRTWANYDATAPIGCENDFTGDGSTLRYNSSTASAMAPVMAAYATGSRPSASAYPFLMIFNTTTHLINISDGTNWRDAAGNIV